MNNNWKKIIQSAWEKDGETKSKEVVNCINKTINSLDLGKLRVAELKDNKWKVNEWIKKAIILYFTIQKWKRLKLVL